MGAPLFCFSLWISFLFLYSKISVEIITSEEKCSVKPALCIKVMQKLLQYNYALLFKVTGSQILSQHALGKRQENTVDRTSLKQACNHQHVGLRCLKMSAHDHTRHVLSGRLFGRSTDGTGISLLLITKLALSRVARCLQSWSFNRRDRVQEGTVVQFCKRVV